MQQSGERRLLPLRPPPLRCRRPQLPSELLYDDFERSNTITGPTIMPPTCSKASPHSKCSSLRTPARYSKMVSSPLAPMTSWITFNTPASSILPAMLRSDHKVSTTTLDTLRCSFVYLLTTCCLFLSGSQHQTNPCRDTEQLSVQLPTHTGPLPCPQGPNQIQACRTFVTTPCGLLASCCQGRPRCLRRHLQRQQQLQRAAARPGRSAARPAPVQRHRQQQQQRPTRSSSTLWSRRSGATPPLCCTSPRRPAAAAFCSGSSPWRAVAGGALPRCCAGGRKPWRRPGQPPRRTDDESSVCLPFTCNNLCSLELLFLVCLLGNSDQLSGKKRQRKSRLQRASCNSNNNSHQQTRASSPPRTGRRRSKMEG
jgi:hypothetical protein